ncbi:MAG: formyltransferase family protein [bacterium]
MLRRLYTPVAGRPMRVAGFMSGSGTNLVKVLERQAELEREPCGSPFRVVVIFTDKPASNASGIGRERGIPVVTEDILAFYRARGHRGKQDLSLRPEFDRRVIEALAPFSIDAVVLAGYMSVVTAPLLDAFAGRIVNVHPADLRILEGGKRQYTGDRAVRDAILAGEPSVRSSTHIVRAEVDYGEVLMVSKPVPVVLPQGLGPGDLARPENRELARKIADEHQERLKQAGDWVILPATLERIARGRYGLDESHRVYLDGEPLIDPEVP